MVKRALFVSPIKMKLLLSVTSVSFSVSRPHITRRATGIS